VTADDADNAVGFAAGHRAAANAHRRMLSPNISEQNQPKQSPPRTRSPSTSSGPRACRDGSDTETAGGRQVHVGFEANRSVVQKRTLAWNEGFVAVNPASELCATLAHVAFAPRGFQIGPIIGTRRAARSGRKAEFFPSFPVFLFKSTCLAGLNVGCGSAALSPLWPSVLDRWSVKFAGVAGQPEALNNGAALTPSPSHPPPARRVPRATPPGVCRRGAATTSARSRARRWPRG
jgi:hypothetical protein